MHWLCCIWYLMVKNEGAWVPPKDTGKQPIDENFPWMRTDFYSSSHLSRYATVFYYAVLAVVGNDLCPRGTAQTFVSIVPASAACVPVGEPSRNQAPRRSAAARPQGAA